MPVSVVGTPEPEPSWRLMKAVRNVATASATAGGFSNEDRRLYVRGLQHIANVHKPLGSYTISDVIEDERLRESSASVQKITPAASLPASASQKTFCAKWAALLPTNSGAVIASYSCGTSGMGNYTVNVTVRDAAWEYFDYDQRLRLAKAFWNGCIKASRVSNGDYCYVHLIGQGGESLGGSQWPGGTIDVNKE